MDFRAKYRIVIEVNWWSGDTHYIVQRKPWWALFYTKLSPYGGVMNHFIMPRYNGEVFDHRFDTADEAESFARKHAEIGGEAWIKTPFAHKDGQIVKDLGRLP